MFNNVIKKIENKFTDFFNNLYERLIGNKDINIVQKYLNKQGLLVFNHYDGFNERVYDVYFNLTNLDNIIFKCDDLQWGNLNSNYIKTFNNLPYLHIGKFNCNNHNILDYKYLANFTIEINNNENIVGEYVSHCKLKELFRFKNFDKILYNQIEELRNLPLKLKEFREQNLLNDINKDF